MQFPIPKITTITTVAQAKDAGCDCVMLKHDGLPVTINCNNTIGNIYTAFNFSNTSDFVESVLNVEPITALFIGAKSRHNPMIFLYDTWWLDGQDVQNLTYRERYVLTRCNVKKLDERFQVVTVAPIQAAYSLWTDCVRGGYKGLVFRRSKDTAAGELFVIRHYVEEPRELQ